MDNPNIEKITGPWLWMIAPTLLGTDSSVAVESGRDFLSEASGGSFTELQIAENGAWEGDGTWTKGEISPHSGNNINELVYDIGLSEDLGVGIEYHVAYGYINLESP